jgi:hypothetical protein
MRSRLRPVQVAGLANHAGPDSAGAFPSVATPVRYTGLAEGDERKPLTCRNAPEGSELVARERSTLAPVVAPVASSGRSEAAWVYRDQRRLACRARLLG